MVIHHAFGTAGRAAGVIDGEQRTLVADRLESGRSVGDEPFQLIGLTARPNEP